MQMMLGCRVFQEMDQLYTEIEVWVIKTHARAIGKLADEDGQSCRKESFSSR